MLIEVEGKIMIYYIAVIIIVILAALCFIMNGKINFMRNRNLFLFFSFFVFFMLSAFRSVDVGVDTKTYEKHYNIILNTSISDICANYDFNSMELGYNLLCKLSSYIVPNYYFWQLIVSALFCFGMYKFIKNNGENYYMAFSVFLGSGLFLNSLNISRQMLAVMFAVNAWSYMKRRENLASIICILLASLFHISALIFGLAYIIWMLRKVRLVYYIIPIVSILTVFNYEWIIELGRIVFPQFNSYYFNVKPIQEAGMIWCVWLIIILISFIVLFKKNLNSEAKLIGIFALIYVSCNLVGLQFNYFERIGLYFLPFVILLFDEFLRVLANKYRFVYVIGVSTCYLILFLISSQSMQYAYNTFFNYL